LGEEIEIASILWVCPRG